jgi:hypothetical protein
MKKTNVIDILTKKLNEQLLELKSSIDNVTESIKGEDKSSAGDKYETSRAMNHIELDRLNELYSTLLKNGSQLNDIPRNVGKAVRRGALVKTTTRTLFFCGGMGKVNVEGVDVLTMSMGSPIGQIFLGKSIGDQIIFNNSSEIIEDIQ